LKKSAEVDVTIEADPKAIKPKSEPFRSEVQPISPSTRELWP